MKFDFLVTQPSENYISCEVIHTRLGQIKESPPRPPPDVKFADAQKFIRHLHISQNTPFLPPNILYKLCL